MYTLFLLAGGFLIGLVVAVPIGPVNLVCIRRTCAYGPLAGFISGLGCALGDGIFASVTAFGLTAISQLIEGASVRVFSKLDRGVFGASLGIVSGLILAIMTWIMLLKDESTMSPNLALLGEYLPGYSVTPLGSLIGLTYGFFVGFIAGWAFALLRNSGMILTLVLTHRRLERNMMLDLFRYF